MEEALAMAAPPPELMWARIEGQNQPMTEARIPVLDHGFLYGDSVYETLRTFGGKVFHLEAHMARLRRSAEGLRIPLPWDDERFSQEIEALRSDLPAGEHYLRVIVTRGDGPMTYALDSSQKARVVILGGPFQNLPEETFSQGLRAVVVSVKRLASGTLDPSLKTGNLLNLRLASMEAASKGAEVALLLNSQGHLTEAASSNLFLVMPGPVLTTPRPEAGILRGVTRDVILKLGRDLGLKVSEQDVPRDYLETAEEGFVTGTTRTIAPLCSLDGRDLSNVPGPVTCQLMQAFRDYAGGI